MLTSQLDDSILQFAEKALGGSPLWPIVVSADGIIFKDIKGKRWFVGFKDPAEVFAEVSPNPAWIGAYFMGDTFSQRRSNSESAGVAYDCESLLTGEEIAAGKSYGNPRLQRNGAALDLMSGNIAVADVPGIAPRGLAVTVKARDFGLLTLSRRDAYDRRNKLEAHLSETFGIRGSGESIADFDSIGSAYSRT